MKTSKTSRLGAFLALDGPERRAVTLALPLITLVKFMLPRSGYGRTRTHLPKFGLASSVKADRLDQILRRVENRLPGARMTCLERSLVLSSLLGESAVIRFGVRPGDDTATPEFHAWVELEGTIVGAERGHDYRTMVPVIRATKDDFGPNHSGSLRSHPSSRRIAQEISAPSQDPIIEVTGLSKTYAPPPAWLKPLVKTAASMPRGALNDLSFSLERGNIVGVLGENGAGKTTLFRCLAGFLTFEAGEVCVQGVPVETHRIEIARAIGIVLEGERGLYGRLTGRQNLEFFAGLNGLSPAEARQRIDNLLERVGLFREEGLVFGYSSGMRVRLSIARALLTNPPLVLLDEPTRSLDSRFNEEVQELMRRHAETGGTVLVSSHDLQMVAKICDRVLVLRRGVLAADFQRDDLGSPAVKTLDKAIRGED